jgi:acyl-coenzyme A thioesterase PaaI-like protein
VLTALDFISDTKKLELYPPFLLMGLKVVRVSEDFRHLTVRLPLRWYGRNHHATMFGGFMASVADPLPALLCGKHFPHCEVWTKRMSITFLRPGRTDLELRVDITQEQIEKIQRELDETGSATPQFECFFWDEKNRRIARVKNIVAMKKRKKTHEEPLIP